MAILRELNDNHPVNYLATLALFGGISCTILMLKFRGFKASLNFGSGKRFNSEYAENVSPVSSVEGTYKQNREQFFGLGSYPDPPKKITPSMVKLPAAFQPDPTDQDVIRATKSTNDLAQASNLPDNLRKSTPNVSSNPQGGTTNNDLANSRKPSTKNSKSQEKEQKHLEKKRLAEQKKREKIEAQERVKEEKLRKEREKAALQEQAKQEKLRMEREKAPVKEVKTKKDKAPKKPVSNTRANPLAQGPSAPLPYTTNTLDSSISKSSGPPPYSEIKPEASEVVKNESDDTGNTSFGKPIDSGSTWDMIAQHRVQVTRTPVTGANQVSGAKQMVIRLQQTDEATVAVTGRKSLYV